jgi:hypothetical protein
LDDEELQQNISRLLVELETLSKDSVSMARLHEIERMIVADVLKENRHLRCAGCFAWLDALVKKAKGQDWY